MITYFLPGHGIYGGIKVAYQFVDALNQLGVPARIAAPAGLAETWFDARASVVARESVLKERAHGTWVFSFPPDYWELRDRATRLAYHCQGTTHNLVDTILADPDVWILTCWDEARDRAASFGRNPCDVGIAVSEVFFQSGITKDARSIAYMPRRGSDDFERARQAVNLVPGASLRPIDGMHEREVAEILQHASIFVATSESEAFGLPALEALASGCLVLSVPVVGGTEYLEAAHCTVVPPDHLGEALNSLLARDAEPASQRNRVLGRAVASRYTVAGMRAKLASCLREHPWPRSTN